MMPTLLLRSFLTRALPLVLGAVMAVACAPEGPQIAEDSCTAYEGDAAVYAVCITRSATLEADLDKAGSRCDRLAGAGNIECRTRWVELNAVNPVYTEESLVKFCLGSSPCDAAMALERGSTPAAELAAGQTMSP